MKTATQKVGTPHRYGTGWLVPSGSLPNVRYFVNGDLTRCTCKGYSFRGHCSHLKIVLEAQQLVDSVLGELPYEEEVS